MMHPLGESRDRRQEVTNQALAEAVRKRMTARRLRQTDLARWSGVSRSLVQSVLRGDGLGSLFLFLELSHGLATDPCELLRELLSRRELLRETISRGSPDALKRHNRDGAG
jgi:transcriptional regulator with XRE-family HTH domain